MKPIMLVPRDPAVELPDALQDVFVFGQLGDDADRDWHIGYMTDEGDGPPTWYLTDSSVPALTFSRVEAWADIPADDPTGRAPRVAAAA